MCCCWYPRIAGPIDDRGATWSFHYPAVTNQNLDGIACPTASRCIAVGSNGTILKSNDGGVTWTNHKAPTEETLLGVRA